MQLQGVNKFKTVNAGGSRQISTKPVSKTRLASWNSVQIPRFLFSSRFKSNVLERINSNPKKLEG